MTFKVYDASGAELTVGATVRAGDDTAKITAITEPDGDVDDEGRAISIPVYVEVEFADGDDDRFMAHSTMRHYDDPDRWVCEDLTVHE